MCSPSSYIHRLLDSQIRFLIPLPLVLSFRPPSQVLLKGSGLDGREDAGKNKISDPLLVCALEMMRMTVTRELERRKLLRWLGIRNEGLGEKIWSRVGVLSSQCLLERHRHRSNSDEWTHRYSLHSVCLCPLFPVGRKDWKGLSVCFLCVCASSVCDETSNRPFVWLLMDFAA